MLTDIDNTVNNVRLFVYGNFKKFLMLCCLLNSMYL